TDITAWCEHEVVLADFVECCDLGKSSYIFVFAVLRLEVVVGTGYACDVLCCEFAVATVDHAAHVASVDEQSLAAAVGSFAADEPQTCRDACVKEQLAW